MLASSQNKKSPWSSRLPLPHLTSAPKGRFLKCWNYSSVIFPASCVLHLTCYDLQGTSIKLFRDFLLLSFNPEREICLLRETKAQSFLSNERMTLAQLVRLLFLLFWKKFYQYTQPYSQPWSDSEMANHLVFFCKTNCELFLPANNIAPSLSQQDLQDSEINIIFYFFSSWPTNPKNLKKMLRIQEKLGEIPSFDNRTRSICWSCHGRPFLQAMAI